MAKTGNGAEVGRRLFPGSGGLFFPVSERCSERQHLQGKLARQPGTPGGGREERVRA